MKALDCLETEVRRGIFERKEDGQMNVDNSIMSIISTLYVALLAQ